MKNSNYQSPLILQDVLKFWKDNKPRLWIIPRMIALLLFALAPFFVILKKRSRRWEKGKQYPEARDDWEGQCSAWQPSSPIFHRVITRTLSGERKLRRYCKRKTVDERYEATDCNVDKHSVGCCGAAEVLGGEREFGSMSWLPVM